MIPIAKEIQVRLLLKEGLSNREIARRTKVARGTIATIKTFPKLRNRQHSPKVFRRVRKPCRCKTCGAKVKILPCLACHPEVGRYDESKPAPHVPLIMLPSGVVNRCFASEAPELFRIVHDIQELHKLGLIAHPLFHTLAHRARDSLQRLSMKPGVHNVAKET